VIILAEGYDPIYQNIEQQRGQIGEQRQDIQSQREQIGQEERAIEKHKRSLRRVSPRASFEEAEEREREYRQLETRERELGVHKEKLTQAETELTQAETELGKQETKIRGYEQKGYETRETPEGKIEFYKMVQVPVQPEQPQLSGETITGSYGEQIPVEHAKATIFWIDESGRTQVTTVPWHERPGMLTSIQNRGGRVQNVKAVSTEQAKQIQQSEEIKASIWYETLPPEVFAKMPEFKKYVKEPTQEEIEKRQKAATIIEYVKWRHTGKIPTGLKYQKRYRN